MRTWKGSSKVEKDKLLSLPNPLYVELIGNYPHLEGVMMNVVDVKNELPVHLILGAGAFCKIKMTERPKVGKLREPAAENTKLGWIIMSPVCEDSNHM